MSAETSQSTKRSGSQRRERTQIWQIAMTPEEYAIAAEKARGAGLSKSSYGRAVLLGSAGPRAKHSPPVNAELFALAIAQLNKAGSNLNQLVRVLNMYGISALVNENFAALAETRAAVASIREIVRRKGQA